MEANQEINKQERKLFPYYCSLCGSNVFVTDTLLETMPRRKTDEAIIALTSKIFFKNYLKKDKLIVVRRNINKYEKQYRYICQGCDVFIAYQSNNFEEEDIVDELKRRAKKIFTQNKKKILYIFADAVVMDPKQSAFSIETEQIKENQAKNISFIRLKKTEVDEFGKEKEKIVYL
jgi:hypothetical protein